MADALFMKRTRKIPPRWACPERYCFLWDEEENRCGEAFKAFDPGYDCLRQNLAGQADWYEPCEPALRRDRLPLHYFLDTGPRKKRPRPAKAETGGTGGRESGGDESE